MNRGSKADASPALTQNLDRPFARDHVKVPAVKCEDSSFILFRT